MIGSEIMGARDQAELGNVGSGSVESSTVSGCRRSGVSRLAGRALVGVAVSAGLVAGTVGGAGTADATCLSVWGIGIDDGSGGGCSSEIGGIALAIGPGATATSRGLTAAISLFSSGPLPSLPGAEASGVLNAALAIGEGSFARVGSPQSSYGSSLSLAVAAGGGSNSLVNWVGDQLPGDGVGNIGISSGGITQTQISGGAFNLGVILFGEESTVEIGSDQPGGPQGYGSTAVSVGETGGEMLVYGVLNGALGLFGSNSQVYATDGFFNHAVKVGGNWTFTRAANTPGLSDNGFFNTAVSLFNTGTGNESRQNVLAGPGPLATAISVGQNVNTLPRVQRKNIGIAINNLFNEPTVAAEADGPEEAAASVAEEAAAGGTNAGSVRASLRAVPGVGVTKAGSAGGESPRPASERPRAARTAAKSLPGRRG